MFSALSSLLPVNFGTIATYSSMLVLLGKATMLLAVALVVTHVMQRTSAVSRHLVWFASLGAILVIPLVIAASPIQFPILPSSWAAAITPAAQSSDVMTDQAALSPTANDAATSQARIDAPASNGSRENSSALSTVNSNAATLVVTGNSHTAEPSFGTSAFSLGTLLLAIWATVALAFATWLAFGMWSVRRIVRNATPLTDDGWTALRFEIADRLSLNNAPALVVSDDIAMPFACGFRTPTIVLPRNCSAWPEAQRTAVMLHEMAHIRRRDIVGHTVGRFACALYWFHPLVWTAAKRMRAESERACDDMALLCGARASDYAEHLLDIVARVKSNTTPPVALAMATRKEFEGRMLAILDPALARGVPSRRQSASLVVSVVALAIVIGVAVPATGVAIPAPTPSPLAIQEPLESHDTRSVAPSLIALGPTASGQAVSNLNLNTEIGRAINADTSERAALLTKILRTESQSELRRVAAWGLHNFADDASVAEALANAVRRDTSARVREMAAWSLESGNHSAVGTGALAAAIYNDNSDAVRLTAVWSLASVGYSADTATVNALLFALKSSNARIREMATWALGSIDLEKAPAGLLPMLRDTDDDIRYSAAWAVYQIGDASAASAIDQALRNEKVARVQLAHVRALTSLGEPAIAVIKRLIDDPDPQVKSMAINALAGGRGAAPWPRPRPMPRPFP